MPVHNYLIDTDHRKIIDIEATQAFPQAEIESTRTMLDSGTTRFNLHPERLIAETASGTEFKLA